MEPATIDLLYLITGIVMLPISLYASSKLAKSRFVILWILISLTMMMTTFFIYVLGDETKFTENPLTPSSISLAVATVTSVYILFFTTLLHLCKELYKSTRSLLHRFFHHKPGNTQIEIRLIRN